MSSVKILLCHVVNGTVGTIVSVSHCERSETISWTTGLPRRSLRSLLTKKDMHLRAKPKAASEAWREKFKNPWA